MLNAVSRMLSRDCEILGSVADGGAFLDTALRLQPDVILLDVNLLNVRSLEACREITRMDPGIKLIMFTPVGDQPHREAFPEAEHLLSFRKWPPTTCCRPSGDCASNRADV